MSEEAQQTPAVVQIDGTDHNIEDLSTDAKIHLEQVILIKRQMDEHKRAVLANQQVLINLQVALGYRESTLRDSMSVAAEPDEAVSVQ